MKATAPVPTVPPETPAAAAPAEPGTPATPAVAKAASWPEWFGAVDALLATIALVLAFLMASFAARNSDLWLHLASGRQIASGEWSLGGDPLSFVDPERPWVRTSWLTDLVGYAAYQADPSGVILVAGKAALFAAAFALFLFLRRPGQSLWPWAVAGTLAVLAAAPYALARPTVVSMAFLSLTLVLVYRLPWGRRSWREPLTLAGVFAVWANADAWFFLGPLAVLLVLAGEALNRVLLGESPAAEAAGDPFPAAPPVGPLARGLAVGAAACLLNPFLLAGLVKDPGEAAAQLLPIELGFGLPAGASDDYDLAGLTRTPLSPEFQTRSDLGNGVNGYCYAALLVLGGVALAAGFARLRAAHVFLWVAFAALSFAHVRLIPFFALAAVPVIAGHVNGLSGLLTLGRAADPKTRILLTACGVGRLVCLLLGGVLLAAAYPGWLHPQVGPAARAYQNRLDWAVEPEAGLARSAERMRDMQAAGLVPAGRRGLGVSPEFANLLAWHAPDLRCFVNARYRFHRRELPDLIAARQILNSRRTEGVPDEAEALARSNELNRVAGEYAADYLVVASAASQRTDTLALLRLLEGGGWVLWHLDGRLAVLGRLTGDPAADGQAEARRLDLARLAFGPDLPPLPEGVPLPPTPRAAELAEQYVDRPRPVPPEADDAAVYNLYALYARQSADFRYGQKANAELLARWAVLGGGRPTYYDSRPLEDEALAVPVLILRAARRAAAANPDAAEPLAALAEAFSMPGAPVLDTPFFGELSERQMQVATAQHRLLERCPTVLGSGVPPLALLGHAEALTEFYERINYIDAAQRAYDKYVGYFDSLPQPAQQELAARRTPGAAKPEDALKALRGQMSNRQDQHSRFVQRGRDQLNRVADPFARFSAAAQAGLPLLAIDLFNALPADGSVTIPPEAALAKVALELRTGRLEAAAADLAALDGKLQELSRQGPAGELGQGFRVMQMIAARLAGNPAADAAALPRPEFPKVTYDPTAGRLPAVLVGLYGLAGGHLALLQSPEGAAASKAPVLKYLNQIAQARDTLLRQSIISHDRALLAARAGRPEEARQWFREALSPQGVPLRQIGDGDGDRAARIEHYVRLIDRAQQPPPY